MNNDVMLDMETGGTIADSVIISIGACRFDAWSYDVDDSVFYCNVDIQSNIDKGRRFSADTLRFWMGQPNSAKAPWFDKEAVKLEEALVSFAEWLGNQKTCLWSMGANFDEPMLAHAYDSFGMAIPWQFWDVRCMRHQKELPGAKFIYNSVLRDGTHHNALDDALHQARCAQTINARLFPASFKETKPEIIQPQSAAKGRKAQKA